MALLLSFAMALYAPPVYADGEAEEPVEETNRTVQISYYVEPDRTYGNPGMLDYEEATRLGQQLLVTKTIPAGEEFTVTGTLKTSSIIGIEQETGDIYVGTWAFSGWKLPDGVSVKQITVSQDGQLAVPDAAAETGEATEKSGILPDETQQELTDLRSRAEAAKNAANTAGLSATYLCTSNTDVTVTGQWQFTPDYQLLGAESIETGGAYPLGSGENALADFFPEREEAMKRISATGVLPESVVAFVDKNIRETPIRDKSFASVEISEAERVSLMNATREAYEALAGQNGGATAVKEGIQSVVDATASDNGDFSTAFVVYCAGQAGLLGGKSDLLLNSADLSAQYEYLKNNACADFISEDELLQIYRAEDGDDSGGVTINNMLVDFAHEEDWYDVASRKSFILPGDLIVFKDGLGAPVSLGIIDSVENRSITYAWCDRFGTPGENTISENDILEMKRAGIQTEIVGLRSCDPARIIYEFLVKELKLPESAAVGVLGNLYYESRYSSTALGDEDTSFGLCQWHNERFLNLVVFCLKNNYNVASLEGQLRYLAYELSGTYLELLSELRNSDMGIDAARKAAYRFCQGFERPSDLEINCALRGATASHAVWNGYYDLFLSAEQLSNMRLSDETPESTMERRARETEYVSYTVRSGDNMMSICASFGIDYLLHQQEVNAMNNITNGSMIYVGQVLIFRRDMINK